MIKNIYANICVYIYTTWQEKKKTDKTEEQKCGFVIYEYLNEVEKMIGIYKPAPIQTL